MGRPRNSAPQPKLYLNRGQSHETPQSLLMTMADTMQAWQYSAVTGKVEDSISVNDIPKPTAASLAKGQLIVQVITAAINPVDYKLPEAGFIGRMMIPRPATVGLDFCGRVVAKHPSSNAFEEGQLVFGAYTSFTGAGTLSQQIVVPEKFCALLPPGVDPDHGAAVGTAATTAYQSLMPDTLKPGAKIFINGGSGGIGTWAIQFAKALGAEVTVTCSTANVELCRQLGADEVIDYKTVDVIPSLKEKTHDFDLVIDNVGKDDELFNIREGLLKPTGTFVQVGIPAVEFSQTISTVKKTIWPSIRGGRKYYFVNMKNNTEFFTRIGQWMDEGKAKAVIDTVYKWEDVLLAFRKLREGHVRGKLVIHVATELN
ncbi:zinc-binding oxidoreductase [Dactylonectria macrodidyma]|uniref:Zinc-binding oxidoreductase n=1 Tax=Dactylonectria macrodidyma TaxID=307937 RepID=A0A9P9E345_9HYPO|nr:zinc-binding oxidoreductase [Dactylonectria macrodidyma]